MMRPAVCLGPRTRPRYRARRARSATRGVRVVWFLVRTGGRAGCRRAGTGFVRILPCRAGRLPGCWWRGRAGGPDGVVPVLYAGLGGEGEAAGWVPSGAVAPAWRPTGGRARRSRRVSAIETGPGAGQRPRGRAEGVAGSLSVKSPLCPRRKSAAAVVVRTRSTSLRRRTGTWDRSRSATAPTGKRIQRKVFGKTKQEVRDRLKALHQELNSGVRSSSRRAFLDRHTG